MRKLSMALLAGVALVGCGVDTEAQNQEITSNLIQAGYKAEDILTLVEDGTFTMGYQSSSYLTDRVPELGFVDLPFLFSSDVQARAAMDGALGQYLTRKTEERCNYRILGWFENGFRHISNKLKPIHLPADMKAKIARVTSTGFASGSTMDQ